MLLQSQQRAFFIGFHESAVANDIGGENGRKATLNVRILQRVVRSLLHVVPRLQSTPFPIGTLNPASFSNQLRLEYDLSSYLASNPDGQPETAKSRDGARLCGSAGKACRSHFMQQRQARPEPSSAPSWL